MDIKHILCPVDFSRFSDAALQLASTLAAESGAALHIVYVEEDSPSYVPGYSGYGLMPAPTQTRELLHREQIEKIRPTVPNVEFSHHILDGQPEKELLKFAELKNIDLIVMGTHGRSGMARVLMGSIAEVLVRHAECPVLTVKQPMVTEAEERAIAE